MSEEIFCVVKNGVATVTLPRPEKRNAHNLSVLDGRTQSFLHPPLQGQGIVAAKARPAQ